MFYFAPFLLVLLFSCAMPTISHAMEEDDVSHEQGEDEVLEVMNQLNVHKLASTYLHILEQLPYAKLKTIDASLVMEYQDYDVAMKFLVMRDKKRNAQYEKCVEKIISKNRPVNRLYEKLDHNTPLVASFYTGSKALEFIGKCIERGADVNYAHRQTSWSPLMIAVEMLPGAVEPLLLAKADPNKRSGWCNEGHNTSLMLATGFNKPEVAEILIKHGATVNFRDENNYSALTCAIDNENVEMVDFLLQKGASVMPTEIAGVHAIENEKKKLEVFEILSK